jgi:hypothetical protein
MNKPFPRLEDLSLLSTTTEEMNLVLPEALQAPDLRRLTLHGVDLPKGLTLLSSTISLSTLSLTHIRDCYFTPRHLVTQLQGLPHLEELSIAFVIPMPLPSNKALEEILPESTRPVTLPALRRFTFRGVDVYLDNLVAQISTPLLERLSLILSFDLTFTLVNLTKFIRRTKGFGCLVARVIFNKDGPSLDVSHYEQQGIGKLNLHVNCEPLDWQIDSAAQVCSALGKVLSAVEELTLDLDVVGMSLDWEDTLDSMLWHELLLPFIGVKKLHIGSLLTLELSEALQPDAGGSVLELLPELQELEVQLEINEAFSAFVEIRESMGRPVRLLAPPIPHAEQGVPHADPVVHDIDLAEILQYMNYIDRGDTEPGPSRPRPLPAASRPYSYPRPAASRPYTLPAASRPRPVPAARRARGTPGDVSVAYALAATRTTRKPYRPKAHMRMKRR